MCEYATRVIISLGVLTVLAARRRGVGRSLAVCHDVKVWGSRSRIFAAAVGCVKARALLSDWPVTHQLPPRTTFAFVMSRIVAHLSFLHQKGYRRRHKLVLHAECTMMSSYADLNGSFTVPHAAGSVITLFAMTCSLLRVFASSNSFVASLPASFGRNEFSR